LLQRLPATAGLPILFQRRQFGAAVDARRLERFTLDDDRIAALVLRDHDDIGEVIFARRIGVADLGQPAEQVLRRNRHHARID